jgi:hypothetical protein
MIKDYKKNSRMYQTFNFKKNQLYVHTSTFFSKKLQYLQCAIPNHTE